MTDLDCKQTEKLIPQFLKDELDNRTEKKFLNQLQLIPKKRIINWHIQK